MPAKKQDSETTKEPNSLQAHLRSASESVVLGIVAIIAGVFWLLNALDLTVSLSWIWSISLAIAGLLCIYLGGSTRFNVINGLFLISLSVFAYLRTNKLISWEVEIPAIITTYGVITLVVTIAWYRVQSPQDQQTP